MFIADRLADQIKHSVRQGVLNLFNDPAGHDAPVIRSGAALFDRKSVAWRVHDDVGTMMIGGIASLLLQMLHPSVLAGVWDHSNFRNDMTGRLRRTARFIAITTYGERRDAQALIARIRGIHRRVVGTLPDGTPYRADDPALLAWVHLTEMSCFLEAWKRYCQPLMPTADQDRYFDETAHIGEALGAAPVPRSRQEAVELIASYRPELEANHRTAEVARLVIGRQGLARRPICQDVSRSRRRSICCPTGLVPSTV